MLVDKNICIYETLQKQNMEYSPLLNLTDEKFQRKTSRVHHHIIHHALGYKINMGSLDKSALLKHLLHRKLRLTPKRVLNVWQHVFTKL